MLDTIALRMDTAGTSPAAASTPQYRFLADARTDRGVTGDYPLLWLLALRTHIVLANLQWLDPHTSVNDDETVFEWWKGERKISAYISGVHVEVIRVWGADIDDEMESIVDPNVDALLKAWRWLLG